MDSRTLHRLATNPKAMMEFRATGRLPSFKAPSSPLITLLQSLLPRERTQIATVTISATLGYSGSRIFRNAQHALNWLVPAGTPSHIASQSWQGKRFRQQLTIDDLCEVATVPVNVVTDWWRRHSHLAHPCKLQS